jgi:hypothetical protein
MASAPVFVWLRLLKLRAKFQRNCGAGKKANGIFGTSKKVARHRFGTLSTAPARSRVTAIGPNIALPAKL